MTADTLRTPLQRLIDQRRRSAGDPAPVLEVPIPMRDGIELAADVYLPAESDRPAPAIVTMTPYDKSGPLAAAEGRYYQRNGYVFVAVDVRGRGKSEGEWRAFVNEGADGHDVVEWVAAQPWCNGKVGMTGISYMGWVLWATAVEQPPHLRCMISTAAAGRWMEEIPYTFGCFQLYFLWWVFRTRRRIAQPTTDVSWEDVARKLPLEAAASELGIDGATWRDMMDHDTLDEFWTSLRLDNRYSNIDVPCLHVAGWCDLEDLLGAFHHYERMVEQSPARGRQQLLVGPWSHIGTRFPNSSYGGVDFGQAASLEMNDIHLRFFDHWLKSTNNGVDADPPVRVFETGSNGWCQAESWPLPSRVESLYLRFDGSDGFLRHGPSENADPERSFVYDPKDPVVTPLDFMNLTFEEPPLDQRALEERADVLTYTSDVLAEEFAVSGWPGLEIYGSSDCDDTDWHVKLTDVDPEGRSIRVASGCLRASYRDSLTNPAPLVPGLVHLFRITYHPVNHAFLPGHRIRVTVTSSDYPWFAPSLNRAGSIGTQAYGRPATNSVHHAKRHPSRVFLPVARGSLGPASG